jgi:hypothetical protein
MSDRRQRLLAAGEVLVSLVRTIQVRRTLHVVWADPPLNFWRVIYGNLTDMAVLEWCKLFGSDDDQNQPIHWKNVALDPDAFKRAMLANLVIYDSKWRSYWTEMKTYRDQVVAHHDERRRDIKRFPTFDLALESSYFYYKHILSELGKLGENRQPKDLLNYGKDFSAQCRNIAAVATDATRSFRESVY